MLSIMPALCIIEFATNLELKRINGANRIVVKNTLLILMSFLITNGTGKRNKIEHFTQPRTNSVSLKAFYLGCREVRGNVRDHVLISNSFTLVNNSSPPVKDSLPASHR